MKQVSAAMGESIKDITVLKVKPVQPISAAVRPQVNEVRNISFFSHLFLCSKLLQKWIHGF